MKTKISHLIALLTIAAAAVLIENAFLQSMSINNQAYDLIAKTTVNQLLPQNFNLMKASGDVALADASVPLFPGAKKLTFGDADAVRYRIDASAGKVANFYNQVMSSLGWQKIDGSIKSLTAGNNLDRVIIALAENPITKKTEAIFSTKSLRQSDIFSVASASAEEVTPQPSVQPLQPIASADSQNNQTPPPPAGDNSQPMPPQQQPMQPIGQQLNGENNNPQPTCRVNGVETPGACPQFNNNGGQNFNTMEFMRPQGEGNNGQQGPSEEDQQKMDEQRLKDMKRGMSQFTRSIAMMKKSVAKNKTSLSKCGVSMPEELVNALNSSDSLVAKINNAKTADELDEAVGDIEDISSVMQDWGPRLGDLNRLCQMLKQADRDQKQLDRSLASYTKKNTTKMDITEILAEYKTNVEGMRQTLADVKVLAKTDAEEALTKLEDDFYGNMDNVRNSEQALNMVLNISQGIRQATSDIKRMESSIKALKKKKVDTADIEAQVADFKQQIADIKVLIKSKFDVDELIGKVETAFDAREQISDALQEYGVGNMEPQIKENKGMNVQVNLPDAFKKQGGNEEGDNQNQGNNQNGPGMDNRQPQNMMPKF
ncbi:MAG: hypothetical protein AUJ11_02935 [Parcubacteria group bacterium CG1_02_44_65]|nr:MAG: hypothetical protein AUJ11_02935 [Parcubacteria group bacterium CG1_02_44_65]